MSRRKILALFVALVSLSVYLAPIARADDPPGAKTFATYCAACHGAGGKGGYASAIGDEKYLGGHSDDAIAQITGEGIVAKGMPAWSKAKGGSLSDAQIADIVAYLRSRTASSASAPAPAPESTTTDAAYAQTRMTVTQATNAEGSALVNALLQRNDGSPVVGASVAFARVTTLGNLDLGTVKTDNSGNATLFLGAVPEAAREVDVNFKGDKNLGSSAGKIVLQQPVVASASSPLNLGGVRLSVGDEPLLPPEGSLVTPNPPLVPTLIIALVVLGVWSAYGYVVSQVVGIWKAGSSAKRENTWTTRAR
ncbi:MAG: cytochrome c [Chloroflexi bacterium]|nr:cytochrome c [Chloroflexota bacterium]